MCETIFVGGETPFQPGFMTEMTVDEIQGLPIGIFQVDGLENEFSCLLFQP